LVALAHRDWEVAGKHVTQPRGLRLLAITFAALVALGFVWWLTLLYAKVRDGRIMAEGRRPEGRGAVRFLAAQPARDRIPAAFSHRWESPKNILMSH
jgi:hypothetical protein